MATWIWIKGRRLKFYDTYDKWIDALRIAKYYQKKVHSHYFIIPYETFATGELKYRLYMNKVYTL